MHLFLGSQTDAAFHEVYDALWKEIFLPAALENRELNPTDDATAAEIVKRSFPQRALREYREEVQHNLSTVCFRAIQDIDQVLVTSLDKLLGSNPDVNEGLSARTSFTESPSGISHIEYWVEADLIATSQAKEPVIRGSQRIPYRNQSKEPAPRSERQIQDDIEGFIRREFTHYDTVDWRIVQAINSINLTTQNSNSIKLRERVKSGPRIGGKASYKTFYQSIQGYTHVRSIVQLMPDSTEHVQNTHSTPRPLNLANDLCGVIIVAPFDYFPIIDQVFREIVSDRYKVYCEHHGDGLPVSGNDPSLQTWPIEDTSYEQAWNMDKYRLAERGYEAQERQALAAMIQDSSLTLPDMTRENTPEIIARALRKKWPRNSFKGGLLGLKYDCLAMSETFKPSLEIAVKTPEAMEMYTSGLLGHNVFALDRQWREEDELSQHNIREAYSLLSSAGKAITLPDVEYAKFLSEFPQ